MVASAIPCSFIRNSGGSTCSESEHASDRERRVVLQRTVQNLATLFAGGRNRFKLEVDVLNDVPYDAYYFGHMEPSKVTVRGRWRTNQATGQRYISFVEILGPVRRLSQARAMYKFQPDGGVSYKYIWAISISITAQIDEAVAHMVEQLQSP